MDHLSESVALLHHHDSYLPLNDHTCTQYYIIIPTPFWTVIHARAKTEKTAIKIIDSYDAHQLITAFFMVWHAPFSRHERNEHSRI